MANEVQGHLVNGFTDAKNPGDFFFVSKDGAPSRLMFICPCGCGAIGGATLQGDDAWQWNGDREKPTLTPSLLRSGGDPNEHCTYHGYLTGGVFRSC